MGGRTSSSMMAPGILCLAGVLWLLCRVVTAASPLQQQVLQSASEAAQQQRDSTPRGLQGRFLHITGRAPSPSPLAQDAFLIFPSVPRSSWTLPLLD